MKTATRTRWTYQCVAGVCEGIVLACTGNLDCDDGDVCNGAESCESGRVCLSGVPLDCGAPTQCAEPACDDGRVDTLGDPCISGVCQSGDGVGIAVHRVAPDAVSPGRHTIEVEIRKARKSYDSARAARHDAAEEPP